MAYLRIFDVNVPTEKTKTAQFDTREIMFDKEYGAYGEAIKKVSEKQYGELAFVFDTLINHLDTWDGACRSEHVSNRLFVWGVKRYYLNLNRVGMECDRGAGKVKITLDYASEKAGELRKKNYHTITCSPAENIDLCGNIFPAVVERRTTVAADEFERVSDTYTIDAGCFIK